MQVAARAVQYLRRLQHPRGSWSDFMVAVGTSDTWVTGYAGTALAAAARSEHLAPAVRAAAAAGADAAADWLLGAAGGGGVWGYHRNVAPDADSTAWAVRLLAARGRPVPSAALEFLAAHESETGYRTYADVYRKGHWSEPTPDVSAAALLARHEAGVLDRAELAAGWTKLIAGWQRPPGRWTSIWWAEDGYPTVLALEAWTVAGRPGLTPVPAPVRPPATAFGHALWLHAYALTEGPADARPLLAAERPGGGWPGDAELLVPSPTGGGVTERSHDARGVFTTATALRALLVAGPDLAGGDLTGPPGRDRTGHGYDRTVAVLAADLGLDPDRAASVFAELTRESLAAPAPWPSAQLSGLAGGLPMELSATDGEPSLRYTTEIGDPVLPPHARALSGLAAIGRTAALLDCTAAWDAVRPAVDVLVDPSLPVPEGCRFWVWAGVDSSTGGGETLKVYLSTLHHDLADGRARERVVAALHRLGLPAGAPALRVLEGLDGYGFCQELGLGLSRDGRFGVKVYYEVRGWQPALVAAVLAAAGLPADPAAVAPTIPGVMNEEVAAAHRAGIALRISPATGTVTEVTTATAFMRPMIGNTELSRRIGDWLATTGDRRTFDVTAAHTRAGWPEQSGRMHGLFTRSLSTRGVRNTVYVRPPLPA
ncbi:hypothetical protein Dvina_38470 [Dactylosporangium vinaceum]|uniref:Uncharacterized protein n=1 Tax=Dactylosporangium vinaceum TaxID=53362 RepID=A0ABV5ML67_9ACTN|nr:hypothetical protein [Dactylosporangium vinaceum]UAB94034.1 hypothetical protein Dvina_38470 [Dactylosporangium vinaceum]